MNKLKDFTHDIDGKLLQYRGDENLKGAGQKVPYTEEHIKEIIKCKNDINYFIQNYYYIVTTDEGKVLFKPYEYQLEYAELFTKNRRLILNCARQIGKTTIVAASVLHEILFKGDKYWMILANKDSMATEILSRVKLAYSMLPKWLQHGVIKLNEHTLELDNGSKVVSEATSPTSARGKSLAGVILDEFAFVRNNVADEFIASVMPTITASKTAKVVMISTPNGFNHFYKFFNGAKNGYNDYIPIEVPWYRIPGRDDEWREETIRNDCGGDESKFLQEHECQFLGTSKTLIPSRVLSNMSYKLPINKEDKEDITEMKLRIYEEPIKEHDYIISVDVAEGESRDFSVITVIDITEYPFKEVAVFRDNKISYLDLPYKIVRLSKKYNKAFILIENNNIGQSVADAIWYDLEYDNIWNHGEKRKIGVRTTKKTKSIGCKALKQSLINEKILFNDFDTISEASTFIEVSKGIFKADEGCTDDNIMTFVNFCYFISTDFFTDLYNKKTLFQEAISDKLKEFNDEEEEFILTSDDIDEEDNNNWL